MAVDGGGERPCADCGEPMRVRLDRSWYARCLECRRARLLAPCVDCGGQKRSSRSDRCRACRRAWRATQRAQTHRPRPVVAQPIVVRPGYAACHPKRRAIRDGRCRWCLEAIAGLSPRGRDPRPYVVVGVRQLAGAQLLRCPKCRAWPPAWRIGRSSARCWICGGDWFVASANTITAKAAGRLVAEQDLEVRAWEVSG